MKIRIVMEIASKDPEAVKGMEMLVNEIRSGQLQRDMEKDSKVSMNKTARCKATVEILE